MTLRAGFESLRPAQRSSPPIARFPPSGRRSPHGQASGNYCIASTDLSGGGFRCLSIEYESGVFLADDPAVSPDGRLVVYTTGNENPQLDVITTSGSGQCCNAIYSGIDFPLRPDWQPRP